jgi:hypothetical protein
MLWTAPLIKAYSNQVAWARLPPLEALDTNTTAFDQKSLFWT